MSQEQSRMPLASLAAPLAVPDADMLECQHRQVRMHLRQFVRGVPARRRRRLWRRRTAIMGSFALCAVIVLGIGSGRTPAVPPFRVEQGRSIVRSDEHHGFSTSAVESATLRTQRGARVFVAAGSRIQAVISNETHEQVQLARGEVRVHVPKLGPGHAFSVQTPDAKVTVHGTVFSVTVAGEGTTSSTCVRVSDGLVSVERAGKQTMVKGGEHLNCKLGSASASLLPPAPDPAPSNDATAAHNASERNRPVTSTLPYRPLDTAVPVPGASRSADTDLAAQNGLLAAALQAERAGRYAEAQAQLEALLARYPASALKPDAERSLERVRRKVH